MANILRRFLHVLTFEFAVVCWAWHTHFTYLDLATLPGMPEK